MSWLFGVKQNPSDTDIPQIPVAPPSSGGGGGNDGDDKSGQGQNTKMDAYRFDSAALERAAKAARELEKSGKCRMNSSELCLYAMGVKIRIGPLILGKRLIIAHSLFSTPFRQKVPRSCIMLIAAVCHSILQGSFSQSDIRAIISAPYLFGVVTFVLFAVATPNKYGDLLFESRVTSRRLRESGSLSVGARCGDIT